jgi:hypothetical protein
MKRRQPRLMERSSFPGCLCSHLSLAPSLPASETRQRILYKQSEIIKIPTAPRLLLFCTGEEDNGEAVASSQNGSERKRIGQKEHFVRMISSSALSPGGFCRGFIWRKD